MAHAMDTVKVTVAVPEYTRRDSHVTYEIEIKTEEVTWRVSRRYQEFVALAAAMRRALPPDKLRDVAELPPKTMRLGASRFDPAHLNDRKQKLETYLLSLVGVVTPDRVEALDDFLEYAEHFLHATIRRLSAVPELQHLVRSLGRASSAAEHTRRSSMVVALPSPSGGAAGGGGSDFVTRSPSSGGGGSRHVRGGGGGGGGSGSVDDGSGSGGGGGGPLVLGAAGAMAAGVDSDDEHAGPSRHPVDSAEDVKGDFLQILNDVVVTFRDYYGMLDSQAEDWEARASVARTNVSVQQSRLHSKEDEIAESTASLHTLREQRRAEAAMERSALVVVSSHARAVAAELARVYHEVAALKAAQARHREGAEALRRALGAWERGAWTKGSGAAGGSGGGDLDSSTLSELGDGAAGSGVGAGARVGGDAAASAGAANPLALARLETTAAEAEALSGVSARVEYVPQGEQLVRVSKVATGIVHDCALAVHRAGEPLPSVYERPPPRAADGVAAARAAAAAFDALRERADGMQEASMLSGMNENAALLLRNMAADNLHLQYLYTALATGKLQARQAAGDMASAAAPPPPAPVGVSASTAAGSAPAALLPSPLGHGLRGGGGAGGVAGTTSPRFAPVAVPVGAAAGLDGGGMPSPRLGGYRPQDAVTRRGETAAGSFDAASVPTMRLASAATPSSTTSLGRLPSSTSSLGRTPSASPPASGAPGNPFGAAPAAGAPGNPFGAAAPPVGGGSGGIAIRSARGGGGTNPFGAASASDAPLVGSLPSASSLAARRPAASMAGAPAAASSSGAGVLMGGGSDALATGRARGIMRENTFAVARSTSTRF